MGTYIIKNFQTEGDAVVSMTPRLIVDKKKYQGMRGPHPNGSPAFAHGCNSTLKSLQIEISKFSKNNPELKNV